MNVEFRPLFLLFEDGSQPALPVPDAATEMSLCCVLLCPPGERPKVRPTKGLERLGIGAGQICDRGVEGGGGKAWRWAETAIAVDT